MQRWLRISPKIAIYSTNKSKAKAKQLRSNGNRIHVESCNLWPQILLWIGIAIFAVLVSHLCYTAIIQKMLHQFLMRRAALHPFCGYILPSILNELRELRKSLLLRYTSIFHVAVHHCGQFPFPILALQMQILLIRLMAKTMPKYIYIIDKINGFWLTSWLPKSSMLRPILAGAITILGSLSSHLTPSSEADFKVGTNAVNMR